MNDTNDVLNSLQHWSVKGVHCIQQASHNEKPRFPTPSQSYAEFPHAASLPAQPGWPMGYNLGSNLTQDMVPDGSGKRKDLGPYWRCWFRRGTHLSFQGVYYRSPCSPFLMWNVKLKHVTFGALGDAEICPGPQRAKQTRES